MRRSTGGPGRRGPGCGRRRSWSWSAPPPGRPRGTRTRPSPGRPGTPPLSPCSSRPNHPPFPEAGRPRRPRGAPVATGRGSTGCSWRLILSHTFNDGRLRLPSASLRPGRPLDRIWTRHQQAARRPARAPVTAPPRRPAPRDRRTTLLRPRPPGERSPAAETIGGVIAGRYTLAELIGEGGMGSVYLASQTEPVKRQVALKLIKAGMDSKQVLARLEAERQALALTDHPNIGRVLDGGIHDGRPLFVMELVKGVPPP